MGLCRNLPGGTEKNRKEPYSLWPVY